jgi:ribosomal protein S18 acetylase RimI-like enzyme
VIVSDWRLLPASTTAELYRRERIRWRRRLAWETASTWHTLETARTTWGLPGLVCHDRTGRVRGWTFYLVRSDRFDIGGFVADDPLATHALLDALLERASSSPGLSGFLYSHAPGLEDALTSRGLRLRTFSYLVHTLGTAEGDLTRSAGMTGWPGEDLEEAARLLRIAYGESGRIFARHNQVHEWTEYVGNLVRDPACGIYSPQLSRALPHDDGLGALAIVTMISPRTAHLAQIAVHPSLQGRGLGQQLLAGVLREVRAAGLPRLSLLVGGDNARACGLYARMGFEERDRFVAVEGSHGAIALSGLDQIENNELGTSATGR